MLCGDSLMIEQLTFQLGNGGLKPTSPLQFRVKMIDVYTACRLNSEWHSRLPIIDPSNVTRNTYYACFGAFYDNECYAVAIWSSPVAQNRMTDGKSVLELRRMAICDNAPKNTASRMLSIMVRLIKRMFPKVKRLISYQDTNVHKGTIYAASGWRQTEKTKYISWTTEKRERNLDQAQADKIRWELLI